MNFFSKHIKLIIFIIIAASLVVGLWLSDNHNPNGYTRTEFWLNTECSITAYGNNSSEAVAAAFKEIARIHNLTDFHSDTSDVTKINRAKANTPIKVDPSMCDILSVALEICEASGGAFDITIAPLSVLWDFSGSNTIPPLDSDVQSTAALVDYKNIPRCRSA